MAAVGDTADEIVEYGELGVSSYNDCGHGSRSYACAILRSMGFTIFHASELDWVPRDDGSGRAVSRLSDSMTQSRANVWRYPPGARGKRHADKAQEEVFVVLDGTLTVDLGEPPERHELERGSVLVVQPGRSSSSAMRATTSSCSSSTARRR